MRGTGVALDRTGVLKETAMTIYEYGLFKVISLLGIVALGYLLFTMWRTLSIA